MIMNSHQHQLADLESIPNQLGHAILFAKDGSLVQAPSESMSQHDIDLLYKILLEVEIGRGDKLRKITVKGGEMVYSICVTADGYIYIVKQRAMDN